MAASAAEEPRRSGRATKGQHKNLDSGDETPKPKKTSAAASTPSAAPSTAPTTAAAPAPTPASSGKKSAKKSARPEPEEADDDGEDDEDVIRCVCGDTSEKGPPDFVSCDACQVWQHNICMDLPTDPKLLPEHYLCEQCQPDDHAGLLAAIERGEKPWEDRKRAWRNAKKRGKNRRKTGDRQSTASELKSDLASGAASSSPAPAAAASLQASGTKRKFEEEDPSQTSSAPDADAARLSPPSTDAPAPAAAPNADATSAAAASPTPTPGPASATAAAAQAPVPHAAASAAENAPTAAGAAQTPSPGAAKQRASAADTKRPEKRRKPSAVEKKVDTETALVDIDELPTERKRPAEALSKVISDNINAKSKAGSYRIPDGHTASSLAKHHAVRIEYALYMNHGPFNPGKPTETYANQFRAIIANMKRNAMLIDRLLKSDLTADELSVMNTEDMASEEEQKKRAALKEEVEKQSVMVQEDEKPRVRRTHKGDEYVDDDSNQPEQSVFASRPVRMRDPEPEQANAATSPTVAQPSAAAASPDRMDIDKPTSAATSKDRRTSSQQFDISDVWAKTHHSPDGEQQQQHQTRPLQQPPRRRSSIQNHTDKGEKNDADVDRLLADDDNDDDEYNPADLTPSDGAVWRGELIQPGVTQLTATGRFVAGNDFGRFMSWSSFLPKILEIEGRLEAKRADDYLCGLQWSKKSDVAILALTPYNNRQAFDQIFNYFASRKRYAVVKKGHGMSDIVKDVYITPVPAGGPLPPHIELLEHCAIDPALPERILIVTFVVNKPAHWDNPATGPIPYDAQVNQNNGNGLPPHLRNGPVASPINSAPPAPAYSPRPEQGFTPAQSQNGPFPFGTNPNALPPNPYSAVLNSAATPQYPTAPRTNHPNYSSTFPLEVLIPRILGPWVNAPTVQQIISSAGADIHENVLNGMRAILDQDPTAAEDMGRLAAHLNLSQPQPQGR